MPISSIQDLASGIIDNDASGENFVDMVVDLRTWGPEGYAGKVPRYEGSRSILQVGGRWDKARHEWSDEEPEAALRLYLQPGQYDAGCWFRDWLTAYLQGNRLASFEDVYALACFGGRRGGKSDFATKAAAMFWLAVPDSITWVVAPAEKKTRELKRVLAAIPRAWFRASGGDRVRTLWTGAELELRTGYTEELVKDGRADLVVLNEGQMMERGVYRNVRAPLADNSGLVIVAANPPDKTRGMWIYDVYNDAKAGAKGWRLFEFHYKDNPTIDHRAIESMKDDPAIGEEDFRRDIGEFIPVGDFVFSTWSTRLNEVDPPRPGTVAEFKDVTARFVRDRTGDSFPNILVADFQLLPYMIGTIWRIYEDAQGVTYPWCTDYVLSEDATEDQLLDDLEAKIAWDGTRYSNASVFCVGDASGEWQDAKRNVSGRSFDYFRDRGYRIVRPDDARDRNPNVVETVRLAKALMCTAAKLQRLRSATWNSYVNKAVERWENRNGAPYKRSPYAHVGDTVRYLAWWGFAPHHGRSAFDYEIIEPPKSGRARDLDD